MGVFCQVLKIAFAEVEIKHLILSGRFWSHCLCFEGFSRALNWITWLKNTKKTCIEEDHREHRERLQITPTFLKMLQWTRRSFGYEKLL